MAKPKVPPSPRKAQASPDVREFKYLNRCCKAALLAPRDQVATFNIPSLSDGPEIFARLVSVLKRKRYRLEAQPLAEHRSIAIMRLDKESRCRLHPAHTMQRRYREFNRKYFANRLPHSTRVLWNPGFRYKGNWGRCYSWHPAVQAPAILLNPKLEDWDLAETLAHEMAHQALDWRPLRSVHGVTFQREMARLEAAGAFKRPKDSGFFTWNSEAGRYVSHKLKMPY